MEYRILGPLAVADGPQPVEISGRRQRALLALLLLYVNELVPADRLQEELWGEDRAARRENALQISVSRLRKTLPAARLITRPPGYVLAVEPGEVDANRFERLLGEGRAALEARDPEHAAGRLRTALALWRGPALADFRYEPFAQAEITRLEELRLEALEQRIDAELACNRGDAVIAELESLIREHPLRERFRAQLMLALYRAGRQADALGLYRDTRRALRDELGIEPGPTLRELERAILTQDEMLAAPARAASTHARAVRKRVTALALELEAASDPEALHASVELVLPLTSAALERHGGRLVDTEGGRAVGVFGSPRLHEDDALRAARAALDLREVLPRFAARLGVDSGEVLAAVERSGAERLLSGAPIRGAERLAERARSGEILLSPATVELGGRALDVEHIGDAWRLLAALPAERALMLRLDAPLVGRGVELARLQEAFQAVVEDRRPRIVTVVGPPGIGKTRLARELASALATHATVLSGRCLSYGEGNMLWPLREIVTQAARGEGRERLLRLLEGADAAEVVADRLLAGLGLGARSAPVEEVFWATRRLLETLARRRPLLVLLEDLHWAETSFLDLVQQVAALTSDAPLLLVCLARPELLEHQQTWPGDRVELDALAAEDADALLTALAGKVSLSAADRARVTAAAEGNPLFLEHLLAMLLERSEPEEQPPATIEALLAARLEQLGPGERATLERASVIGRDFSLAAVVELLPGQARASATRNLESLVRRGLAEPFRSDVEQNEDHRFRHVLIQQSAYRAMPKRLRAELHERFADWLEADVGIQASSYDAVLGYHLERAYRLHEELGRADEAMGGLRERGGLRLARAGRRAFEQGDLRTAATLLERATSLLPDGSGRLDASYRLGVSLGHIGELDRAGFVLITTAETAAETGERRVERLARLAAAWFDSMVNPEAGSPELVQRAEEGLAAGEELGDDELLANALYRLGFILLGGYRTDEAVALLERARSHARRVGQLRDEVEIVYWLAITTLFTATPVPLATESWARELAEAGDSPALEGSIRTALGLLHAMNGDLERARSDVGRAAHIYRELGLALYEAATGACAGLVELIAGDAVAAESALRPAHEAFGAAGDREFSASTATFLGEALYRQERYDEAEHFATIAAGATDEHDLHIQAGWRMLQARLLARKGSDAEAVRLAREAVALVEPSDALYVRGDTALALAETYLLVDRRSEARDAAADAIRLYEQKGCLALARRGKTLLASLDVFWLI